MKKLAIATLIIMTAGMMACGKAPKLNGGSGDSNVNGENPGDPQGAGGTDPNADPTKGTMLTCAAAGKVYKGFGNVNLVDRRVTSVAKEGDRFRVKPYTALSGEYTRVTGKVPPSLTANATTFSVAPDRWYVDTQASAVTLFTSYRVAYESALGIVATDAKYAAAPTEESATANCTVFARQAWNRLPSAEEIGSCKKVALVDTLAETDLKARWAYALASILTSADFLSY